MANGESVATAVSSTSVKAAVTIGHSAGSIATTMRYVKSDAMLCWLHEMCGYMMWDVWLNRMYRGDVTSSTALDRMSYMVRPREIHET